MDSYPTGPEAPSGNPSDLTLPNSVQHHYYYGGGGGSNALTDALLERQINVDAALGDPVCDQSLKKVPCDLFILCYRKKNNGGLVDLSAFVFGELSLFNSIC